MLDPTRCDAALWDVTGGMLGRVRSEMTARVSQHGPRIETVAGEWRGGRLAIARARALTASQQPTLTEAVRAVAAAHRPARLLVVGPAAAASSGLSPGEAAISGESSWDVAESWSVAAREAATECGYEATLVAIVTLRGNDPPATRRPTFARRAGRWLGSLASGGPSGGADDWSDAAARAVADVLGRE